jgi:hypothetical protein
MTQAQPQFQRSLLRIGPTFICFSDWSAGEFMSRLLVQSIHIIIGINEIAWSRWGEFKFTDSYIKLYFFIGLVL